MRKLQLLNAQERATKRQTKRGFFKRSYQDGLNTICIYDDMGADFVMTIGATEIYPLKSEQRLQRYTHLRAEDLAKKLG